MSERAQQIARLTLPPGGRLIHAGMPKTGTTALQRTAAARRDLLLEHGVRYPGTGTNHRKALFAYSHRRTGWSGADATIPSRSRWWQLHAELQAEDRSRVWLSNENLSEEPEDTLGALLGEVGGPPTVVLTMRSLPAQLASAWQQYLKSGVYVSFETWLCRVLGDVPDPETTPSFRTRIDLGDVVEKWVRLVEPDRVVVVVLDPADRALVPRTFEGLLDLPLGTLDAELQGQDANRSMSFAEAELVRRVNIVVRQLEDVSWRDYERYVRDGAIDAMLATRTPGADEPRVVPPSWAVAKAVTLAEQHARRIAATGVRVIGKLENLAAPVATVEQVEEPTSIPLAAATEALLAVFSTGLGRGRSFGASAPPPVVRPRIEDLPTSAVVRLLTRRARRSVRRRFRRR